MGFQQGLSGLAVSSRALDAIGNNLANANTVGFKAAQVQFADVYAASLSGGGASQIGIGASAPAVAQQFTQGNITTTNNPLDIAINGGGFFRMSDGGTVTYTRNGQFHADKDGYIVNASGLRLTGYAADATGAIVPGDFTDMRLNNTNIEPQATTASQVQLNLDSRAVPPTAMTSGAIVGSQVPGTLTIEDATGTQNDPLQLVVDGIAATVTIPAGTYTTAGDLANAVEAAINANPALVGANALVDVSVSTTGAVQITSRSRGSLGAVGLGSYVAVTPAAAGDGAANLLGPAPVASGGNDAFRTSNTLSYTASTAQTVYDTLGNPHNLTMYFAKTSTPNTWQMYSTLDGEPTPSSGSATGSLSHDATTAAAIAAADTFDITVDGVTATGVAPAGGYADTAAMIADLQTQINTDLATAAAAMTPPVAPPPTVTVSLNGGRIVVTSDSTGTASGVAITNQADPDAIFGQAVTTFAGGQPAPTVISFTDTGALATVMPLSMTFDIASGAVDPLNFTLDLTGTSQYGISFSVNQLLQDGFTSGRLAGLSVAQDGTIQGRYTNGQSRNMGQLVLANFNNPNGLTSLGGNQWAETAESGQPIPGIPGQGSLGVVQSARVEESNIDLTAELVNMITQQRVYQANAQTIRTQDQILNTLVNLR